MQLEQNFNETQREKDGLSTQIVDLEIQFEEGVSERSRLLEEGRGQIKELQIQLDAAELELSRRYASIQKLTEEADDWQSKFEFISGEQTRLLAHNIELENQKTVITEECALIQSKAETNEKDLLRTKQALGKSKIKLMFKFPSL